MPGLAGEVRPAVVSSTHLAVLREPGAASFPPRGRRVPLKHPHANLGVVFDHVAIAVSDLAASERFYRTILSVLGVEPSHADAELVEWEDWDIGPTDPEHPLTRGLHVGFRAPSRAAVDAFWQAGIDAGYRDDGPPGPRTHYGADYYGGFLLDPDGNSAEAVHRERARPVPDGRIDHLWIRVADLAASKRFYTTIAPFAGIRLGDDEPGRVQFRGDDYSFSLIDDGRPLTEHVHLAFAAREDATVRAFHAAALAARVRGPRRPRGAHRLPPGLLRRVRPGSRRAQRRSRQPQPLSDDRPRAAPAPRATASRSRSVDRDFETTALLRPPDQPAHGGDSTPLSVAFRGCRCSRRPPRSR